MRREGVGKKGKEVLNQTRCGVIEFTPRKEKRKKRKGRKERKERRGREE